MPLRNSSQIVVSDCRKACILKNTQFDFLMDKVEHVPDVEAATTGKRGKSKSDFNQFLFLSFFFSSSFLSLKYLLLIGQRRMMRKMTLEKSKKGSARQHRIAGQRRNRHHLHPLPRNRGNCRRVTKRARARARARVKLRVRARMEIRRERSLWSQSAMKNKRGIIWKKEPSFD